MRKPTCSHILSFGCRLDCVFIVGTLLFGAFLSLFSLSLDFNLFARFSIGVILFSIILLSLCLSLSGRVRGFCFAKHVLFGGFYFSLNGLG